MSGVHVRLGSGSFGGGYLHVDHTTRTPGVSMITALCSHGNGSTNILKLPLEAIDYAFLRDPRNRGVQHRRRRCGWGVGARGGRAKGGCEDVETELNPNIPNVEHSLSL